MRKHSAPGTQLRPDRIKPEARGRKFKEMFFQRSLNVARGARPCSPRKSREMREMLLSLRSILSRTYGARDSRGDFTQRFHAGLPYVAPMALVGRFTTRKKPAGRRRY